MATELRDLTCCFTGHRPNKLAWGYQEEDPRCLAMKRWMAQAIQQAWDAGYLRFICGMALGCDLSFCEAALDFRQTHPELILEAAIPCPQQADRWRPEQKQRWQNLVEQCSHKTVLSPVYSRWCMLQRDRYMVDHSSRIIAVFNGTPGGTMQTLTYAMRKKLDIVRLDPEDL